MCVRCRQSSNGYSPSRSPGSGSHTSSHGSGKEVELSKTNLYIRGLGPETTDQHLRTMCAGLGQVNSTKAILDKSTGQCKGQPCKGKREVQTSGVRWGLNRMGWAPLGPYSCR